MLGPASSEIRDDLQLVVLQDVLAPRALPARHRHREHVGEAEQQAGLVRQQAMLEQAEQLLPALVALDVVEVLQRRLGAPAQEQRGQHVGLGPAQDLLHLRPDVLVAHPLLQRVDAGDDEAVELAVLDLAPGGIELADMLGRRVLGLAPGIHVVEIGVRRREGQLDLQAGVAEPQRQLPLGGLLVRHQVDDRDLERADVLVLGARALDRQRRAERRQERVDRGAVDDDWHKYSLRRLSVFLSEDVHKDRLTIGAGREPESMKSRTALL